MTQEPILQLSPESKTSLVRVRIGNRTVDARKISLCHTCNHPARMQIEEALLLGDSLQKISQRYSGVRYRVGDEVRVLPKVDWKSIDVHHKRGHMPVTAEIIRSLMEERAKAMGVSYEEMGQRFVDGILVAKMVLAKGQEGLALGHLQPDVKETLAAAKFLHEVEQAEKNDQDTEIWAQAMQIYFESARELMSDEMWIKFTSMLTTNPILRRLSRKIEGKDDEDVLDVEYQED